ncbi:hypothetical protein [Streptomyces ziwulingensis]|uniref:Transposase n=1 Tax=Streptomyces ziwulingensis TaxID=1045501 RepID=A0ABP9D3J2_9ACTN
MRCRLAHNQDTSRGRGLDQAARRSFLAVLNGGGTVEDAAEIAGVTVRSLAQAARRDGELRAALDGMPVDVQFAARRAEALAALVRCGGNQSMAEVQAGLRAREISMWRHSDADFDAVVAALQAWLRATAGKLHRRQRRQYFRLPSDKIDRFRELWMSGVSCSEINAELGISPQTMWRWRKKMRLPSRRAGDHA